MLLYHGLTWIIIGIDTCYFEGMDAYAKTWLQLASPTFMFLLVGIIIIGGSYSTKFAHLINPVATLATLILLSYAKLLQVSFQALSSRMVTYPNGSSERVWLPDATVKYFSVKHIFLFAVSIVILLVGLVYTVLLFSGLAVSASLA